jgi:sRNA-binding protein
MDFKTVFTTLSQAEADMVRSRLESSGFDVCVVGENSCQLNMDGNICVQVDQSQIEDARALLETVDQEEPA